MAAWAVLLALVGGALGAAGAQDEWPRYGFWRSVRAQAGWARAAGSRRVFGGEPAALEAYPGVVALLDRYWGAQCSGAWLAGHWVLTAAHCVTPAAAYVRYNARRPGGGDGGGDGGDTASVHYLFRHPEFRVVQEDVGRGEDVTLLHHDVGLVRTRELMRLRTAAGGLPPLERMALLPPHELPGAEVEVVGFGGTDSAAPNDQLFAVRLQLVACERAAWFHCVCAVGGTRGGGGGGGGGGAGRGGGAGVCQGDSGGPVLLHASGAQVAVTSMGPMQCAASAAPPLEATSVLTALQPYVPLINATMLDVDAKTMALTRTRDVKARAAPPPTGPPPATRALLLAALCLSFDIII